MPSPNKNSAVIACAGAGKTTTLVAKALSISTAKVLLTTYTNENVAQLRQFISSARGVIPKNMEIESWFTFLLREGVRPYQNALSSSGRARSIFFQQAKNKFRKKDDYFTKQGDIYSDKLSEFVHECNKTSGGRIISRLEKMYDYIFIDELQDLAGYDLNVIADLIASKISVALVGDPRQATYSTNRSAKNKKYKRQGVFDWIKELEAANEVQLEVLNKSFRCNQSILDISDTLYPNLPKNTSGNTTPTGHDGVFAISPAEVPQYLKNFQPILLRYSEKTDTGTLGAMNIGITKGRTFDRVLIFPTKKMEAFLATGKPDDAGDKCRLYVALTRARHSVAFVIEDPSTLSWLNSQALAQAVST